MTSIDLCTVPNGTFPCRVAEVRSRVGCWAVRWQCDDGPYDGYTVAWQVIGTQEYRTLRRLGLRGRLIAAEDLHGRRALVTVAARERSVNGQTFVSHRVVRLDPISSLPTPSYGKK